MLITHICCPFFIAQRKFEGSWPVRDQGESVGWAGQQVAAYTRTRRTSRCPLGMEDESCVCRQLLSQQAWWAACWAERRPGFIVFQENGPKLTLSQAVLSKKTNLTHISSCKVNKTFCTFCLTGFSHRRLGVFGSPIFHRQYHSPLKEVCSELHFLPGKRLNSCCGWVIYVYERLDI